MNYRVFYLTLFLLFVFGIALLLFSYPHQREMALIYFKDRRYQESYEIYKKLYEEGDQKLNVILPLIELNLLFGDTKGAVSLMEKVMEEYPNLPKGREWLGELYKYDSRPGDYLANLEKQVEEHPTQDKLKELIELYDEFGQTEQMMQAYEKLIALGNKDESTLYSLAFLKANQQRLEEAIEVLSLLDLEKVKNIDTVLLYVNILLDSQKEPQAFQVASQFLEKRRNVQEALTLSNAFNDYGYPKDAFDLIVPYENQVTKNPELFAAFVMYGKEIGQKEKIYDLLSYLFANDALPNVVLDSFLVLAMEEKDNETLERITQEVSPEQFSETILIDLINYAYLNEQRPLIQWLQDGIPPARVNQSNLLKLAFFMTKDPTLAEFKEFYSKQLKERSLTVQDKYDLEDLLYNSGNVEEANFVFDSITSLEGLSAPEIERYALIGIELGKEKQASVLVHEFLSIEQGATEDLVGNALVLLAAAAGDDETVIDAVVNAPKFNAPLVGDLFYIALRRKDVELSLFLAKIWYDTEPNIRSERALVSALILDENYQEALPIIQRLIRQNPGLYELIEPYFVVLAKTANGDPKKIKELKKLIAKAVGNPNIPKETKAIWGYVLIDQKEKALAEVVFAELVQQGGYQENYVNALFDLWGQKPTQAQVDWLVQIVKEAKPEERKNVIDYLVYIEKPELVKQFVTPQDLKTYDIARSYLNALILLWEKEEFEKVWCLVARREQDPKKMMELAELASDFAAFPEAVWMYQRILEKEPNNRKALQKLGYSAYLMGWYPYAFEILSEHLMDCPEDYIAYYYYAQILFQYGYYEESYPFFCEVFRQVEIHCYNQSVKREKEREALRVRKEKGETIPEEELLANIEAEEADWVESQTFYADSLYKLQRRHESLRMFKEMVDTLPDRLSLVFELVIHLEAAKYYTTALEVLECWTTTLSQDLQRTKKTDWNTLYSMYIQKVRLLRQMWRVCEAQELLDEIYCHLDKFFEKENFWVSVAELENQLGQWRASINSLGVAQAYNPYDCGIGELAQAVYEPHRPYIQPQYDVRLTDSNQTERIFKLEGFERYQEKYFAKVTFEVDNATARLVQNPNDGTTSPFRGYRYRGEITGGIDLYNGDQAILGLFWGNETFGGQAGYTRKDRFGQSSLLLWYHQPTWIIIEAIEYMGTLDEIKLGRIYHFSPRLRFEGDVSLRFWGVDHKPEVAKSMKLNTSLIYSLSDALFRSFLGEGGFLDFVYSIDAEYIFDRKKLIDPFGESIPVLNLLTQETHTGFVIFQYDFSKWMESNNLWEFEAFYGYSMNRFGKGAPNYGAAFSYQKQRSWSALMSLTQTASTTTPGTTKEFIFRLRHPF